MKTRTRAVAALALTILVGVACGTAPRGSEQAATSATADATAREGLLPDGIWEAVLSAEDLAAAGAADAAEPGRYVLTVDGTRVRVALEGEWQCDADAKAHAGAVRLSWHAATNCGGFDTIQWQMQDDGLYLELVDTSGNEAGTRAILETEPYQQVEGEATLSWSDAWTTCTNPDGGACLDDLEAATYETSEFETPFTYTVPAGWANYEDLPGNYLLVPPSGTLEGVDRGTSDYISILDGVAAQAPGCIEGPAEGVDRTPEAMMTFFAARTDLDVTDPKPVTVGGLEGFVANISLADDHTERCPQLPDEFGPFGFLLVGVGPADFNHGVFGELVMRLYLLAGPKGEVLAIEVNDVPGGESLEELEAVAESIVFTTGSSGSPTDLEPRHDLPSLEEGEVAACTDLCGDPPRYRRVTPGEIPAGRYQTRYFFGGYMTLDVGPGWSSVEDSTAELQLFPPDEAEYGLHFGLDPFPVDDGEPVETADTAAQFLDWLAANPKLITTVPADAQIGDMPARSVDVALSDAAENEAADCPDEVCVLFIGDDQIDHFGGIAGDDMYRFYFADVEYSGSSHLLVVTVEGRDHAHLLSVLPLIEEMLATVTVPASPGG